MVGGSAHLRGTSDAFLALIQMVPNANQQTSGSIVFSTLIGGSGDESAKSVALIPSGSLVADAVVAGWTSSFDFPLTSGVPQVSYQGGDADGFVSRIQIRAVVGIIGPLIYLSNTVYSTYLGGENEDVAYSVTADATGVALVTGYTRSRYYFPTTFGCFQPHYGGGYADAFIVKLDGYGKLLYATYFGGSGDDYGEAILAGYGFVYLVGYTDSYNLPLTSYAFETEEAGGWDTFATVFLDDCLSLVYSSYFGTWGEDFAYGAALDGYGNLVFGGSTNATRNGDNNVLLLKLEVPYARPI